MSEDYNTPYYRYLFRNLPFEQVVDYIMLVAKLKMDNFINKICK